MQRREREHCLHPAPQAARRFRLALFRPEQGIPEDPVTGSAHCTLVPYWAERLGKSEHERGNFAARREAALRAARRPGQPCWPRGALFGRADFGVNEGVPSARSLVLSKGQVWRSAMSCRLSAHSSADRCSLECRQLVSGLVVLKLDLAAHDPFRTKTGNPSPCHAQFFEALKAARDWRPELVRPQNLLKRQRR